MSALQVDPFVQLSVRDGRKLSTKTVWNNKNPEYNEVLNFIVDDPKTQSVTAFLMEHDFPFHKVAPSPPSVSARHACDPVRWMRQRTQAHASITPSVILYVILL